MALRQEAIVQGFYSRMYRREKQDSPDASRYSLERRAKIAFSGLPKESFVLDLGAGRRIFEREYNRSFGVPGYRIVTVDFADIKKDQLLIDHPTFNHFQADGKRLPFASGSFSGAVSNMALDFMGHEAIEELSRVLKPQAVALINLHHPFLIPPDIEKRLENRFLNPAARTVLTFWKYLKDNDILFKSKEQIIKAFQNDGFKVLGVKEAKDGTDKWWELDMVKS